MHPNNSSERYEAGTVRSRWRRSSVCLLAGLGLVLACAEPEGIVFTDDFGDNYVEVTSPEDLVTNLAQLYRLRDVAYLDQMLVAAPDLPEFRFDAYEVPQPESWGRTEEMNLTTRMFKPETTTSGVIPVPQELWITSISIRLTKTQSFTERTGFYASSGNPLGLSPDRWKVFGAVYEADILFVLQSEIDYTVQGLQEYLVVEDLATEPGAEGRFHLLQWIDRGPVPRVGVAVDPHNWSDMKRLYAGW
jgi:hypothetical protein